MEAMAWRDVEPGRRTHYRVPLGTLVNGLPLFTTFHVVKGVEEGPVLGLVSNSRGIGHLSVEQVRTVVASLDPRSMRGSLIACPVANPMAFEHRTLTTPVDEINMNRVFPGTPPQELGGRYAGGLTELMAHHVARQVIDPCDVLIDLHLLSDHLALETIDLPAQAEGSSRERIRQLACLFGTTLHEWELQEGSAVTYALSRGKLGFGVEIGSGGWGEVRSARWVSQVARGVRGVMQVLGMLPGEPEWPEATTVITSRVGIRPRHGGYHVPEVGVDDLGHTVEAGRVLGRIYDTQTFELLEELNSPYRGILYVIRAYGPTQPGDWAYVVGEERTAWRYVPKRSARSR
ncbi:MAG: succinylglutamate desuccinylase/aspartoacylase family protein [Armatimonadota bacterium]|nr:succinylglutamate desuccinylase/aspartoacylase family protein [Armatimonadota bacterium]